VIAMVEEEMVLARQDAHQYVASSSPAAGTHSSIDDRHSPPFIVSPYLPRNGF